MGVEDEDLKRKIAESITSFQSMCCPYGFSIRVTNDCNISREFDFYDSIVNYEANKEDLTEKDLKNTFRYIINDGINGGMEFEEFCDEFGDNTDSRKVESIHKLCEGSLEKLNDLGITDLIESINELSKQGVGD